MIIRHRRSAMRCLLLLLIISVVMSLARAGETEPNARQTGAEPRRLVTAVVLSRDLAPYHLALVGFADALQAAGFQPFVAEHDLGGKAASAAAVVTALLQSPPDLIVTMGTLATRAVARDIHHIPIVFAMVLEPEASLLIPEDGHSRRNLTGIKMDITPGQQLDALQEVLPKVKRVGVLYSEAESSLVLARTRTAATKRGITLIAKPIRNTREVPRALRALSPEVDALLAIPDATVYTESSTQYILLDTLRQAQPFIGLLESFVKAGALMGLGLDYADLGRQAGELAVRIQRGADPGDIQILGPRKTQLLVNERTARRIGVTLSAEVREKARAVGR